MFHAPILNMLLHKVVHEESGMSYGLSACGYDIRIAEDVSLPYLGEASYSSPFSLASAIEEFDVNSQIVGFVKDKSSWARQGLSVFNTVIEPGWRGFLTLELINNGPKRLNIKAGTPIAQVVFQFLDAPTILPYTGKYQDQQAGPQGYRKESTRTKCTICDTYDYCDDCIRPIKPKESTKCTD